MIDVKAARQDPGQYRAALARRGAERDFDALLAADRSWRSHTERAEALRAAQKRSSKGRPPGPAEIEELRQLKEELAASRRVEQELWDALAKEQEARNAALARLAAAHEKALDALRSDIASALAANPQRRAEVVVRPAAAKPKP